MNKDELFNQTGIFDLSGLTFLSRSKDHISIIDFEIQGTSLHTCDTLKSKLKSYGYEFESKDQIGVMVEYSEHNGYCPVNVFKLVYKKIN